MNGRVPQAGSRCVIPEGCMLKPAYPARRPVAGNCRDFPACHQRHLRRAGGDRNSQGTMNNLTFGNDEYQYYETNLARAHRPAA